MIAARGLVVGRAEYHLRGRDGNRLEGAGLAASVPFSSCFGVFSGSVSGLGVAAGSDFAGSALA